MLATLPIVSSRRLVAPEASVKTGHVAGLVCALASAGCSELAGVSDYSVENDPPGERGCAADELRMPDGSCRRVPDCGEQRVAVSEGECVDVGVRDCGGGTPSCDGLLPPRDCVLGRPGESRCTTFFCGPHASLDDAIIVQALADEPGDGTKDAPFPTIAQAVVAAREGQRIRILPGTYAENVSIDRRLNVLGTCANEVHILGAGTDATVRFTASAAGSSLERVHVGAAAGGSSDDPEAAGIHVEQASNVTLRSVLVSDISGAGIVVDDVVGESVLIDGVLVERATRFGIAAHGSRLDVQNTVIRATRLSTDGDFGYGIAVHPASFAPVPAGAEPLRPEASRRSELTLDTCTIEHTSGAGLHVEGSSATVIRTVIRDTAAQRDGRGRGAVVQPRFAGNIEASLTIQHSVIENSHDAGVVVWNAGGLLENVWIRGVSGRGTEPCMGSGVRARWDRGGDPSTTPLAIKNCTIEGAVESGVHVQGASVKIDDSLVKDVGGAEACAEYGDGVAAYAGPVAGKVEIRRSRVERTRRAAVAVEDLAVTLDDTWFVGCEGSELTRFGSGNVTGVALCRCNGVASPCPISDRPLISALRGRASCDATDGWACFERRMLSYPEPRTNAIGASAWSFWDDDVRPALTDGQGIVRLEGLTPSRRIAIAVVSAHVPWLFETTAPSDPALENVADELVANGFLPTWTAQATIHQFLVARGELGFDFRQTWILVNLAAVPGWKVKLDPPSGTGPWYTNADGAPDMSLTGSLGPWTHFLNVTPGTYRVHFEPPPGYRNPSCTAIGAWNPGPTSIEMRAVPGFFVWSGAVCTAEEAGE